MNMKYCPVKKHWADMYKQYEFYEFHKKFPIQKIRLKPLCNKINMNDVYYMLMNFDKEVWMPITLDMDYFLTDGQHRLELARRFGMEFIDVVILDEKKMNYPVTKP